MRKALGAKQRDVLLQFLIESASLALVGGALAYLAESWLASSLRWSLGFRPRCPLWAIFLGLVPGHRAWASSLASIPASKAAKLDPVVASARGDVREVQRALRSQRVAASSTREELRIQDRNFENWKTDLDSQAGFELKLEQLGAGHHGARTNTRIGQDGAGHPARQQAALGTDRPGHRDRCDHRDHDLLGHQRR